MTRAWRSSEEPEEDMEEHCGLLKRGEEKCGRRVHANKGGVGGKNDGEEAMWEGGRKEGRRRSREENREKGFILTQLLCLWAVVPVTVLPAWCARWRRERETEGEARERKGAWTRVTVKGRAA
jgi:hypothetical protein